MTDFEYCIILLPGGGDPIMADIVQPNLVKVGKTLRWAIMDSKGECGRKGLGVVCSASWWLH